ncbi:GDSL-type esterase/lipase family protein [Streptomyces caniscabiei]|uniref:Hydrolase n=1 Tax=Streptomyces caniscabiei TaxID=2746961 RepID=A0A927QF26_9ACTN|nr:SGNH/GDSL hydrolase family protein [Streptomyces caniscabiei]MBD9723986.1 hydrolase [Streptomyces caniscabiei]MDX3511358.1 GDSL-type esterase/lipase family protein [Streptomyces caniscabiei]MDX3718461.1 GDSL-type esterase/lipase family protein [Streptomyces caniscabiei]MDX3727111.1 GDSL-type esterase/lipase family protein [Streptomyces caniscabiei]WEO22134.1 GDSL-type esterase/lipase family protein [Streptomyces caniscabiei]
MLTFPHRSGRGGVAAVLTAVLLACLLSLAGATQAQAAPGDGSVSDPNIVYVGRWDTGSGTTAVANWTGAYVRTSFTGTTVKVRARDAVNFYVSVDGGPDVFHAGVRGTVNLTPRPLAPGTHSLRIAYRSGDTVFQGLVLDPGARTVAPGASPGLIEFVGDSITAGALTDRLALDSYAWRTGERLGMRHTRIARAGYCLVARSGCTGLGGQFFKVGSTGGADWDFSRYRANAVVINLGTNDIGHGVTGAEFQAAYTALLRDVRAKYPDAFLFAVQTLKKRYVAETRAAVAARGDAGDGRVRYVDTTGWLTDGADYEDGNGHPNEAGHTKFADRLAPIVNGALNGTATATASATARTAASATAQVAAPGQPGDPNIKFVGRWDTTGSATAYTPYWAGAYYRVGFTGRTVQLKQRGTIDFWARIDDGPVKFYDDVKGTVNLTPAALPAGRHTLQVNYQVVAGSYRGDAVFQGLVLDSGATTFAPAAPARTVEFVGDSITVGTTTSQNARTAYGWLIGERLGTEHTQIAQGGACLVAAADGCVGLERQYGKLNPNAATPDWDFGRYRADAVVINLGTNDVGHGVSPAQFQTAYASLLRKVRAAHPGAWIFALETFRGRFVPQTEAAVQGAIAGGDSRVSFVDTTGWLGSGDLTDSVHPNDRGHRAVADRLAPVIAARIGG